MDTFSFILLWVILFPLLVAFSSFLMALVIVELKEDFKE